jgi:hypothetical protein
MRSGLCLLPPTAELESIPIQPQVLGATHWEKYYADFFVKRYLKE